MRPPLPAIGCPICKRVASACMCPTYAPKGATCPACALDVGGLLVGRTSAGATTWDRATRHDAGPSGVKVYSGGLTHVEGGERCLAGIGHQ